MKRPNQAQRKAAIRAFFSSFASAKQTKGRGACHRAFEAAQETGSK